MKNENEIDTGAAAGAAASAAAPGFTIVFTVVSRDEFLVDALTRRTFTLFESIDASITRRVKPNELHGTFLC